MQHLENRFNNLDLIVAVFDQPDPQPEGVNGITIKIIINIYWVFTKRQVYRNKL